MFLEQEQPAHYLRITVGSPVYSHDDKKIGKVKQVEGRSFKVDAPLRPDYWLSDEVVDAAVPDQSVILRIDAAELARHREKRP